MVNEKYGKKDDFFIGGSEKYFVTLQLEKCIKKQGYEKGIVFVDLSGYAGRLQHCQEGRRGIDT